MARVGTDNAYATVPPNYSTLITDLFYAGADLHWDTWCLGREANRTPKMRPIGEAAELDRPTSRRKSIPGVGAGTNLKDILSFDFRSR